MILKYKLRCTTESADKYWYLPSTSPAPTKCPDNTEHTCDLSSVAVIDSNIPAPVLQLEDGRSLGAVNRIPAGYTIVPYGAGDDITNGVKYVGERMVMDAETPSSEMQMLKHFYAVGGRLSWEGASLEDEFNVDLIAPATTGLVEETGDYVLYSYGAGHLIIPVPSGTGNRSLSLTAKLNAHVNILKCTPIPIEGNTGYFDYNSATNELTRNLNGKGGYHLFDFDVPLIRLANRIPGRKGDGSESTFESTDVVGKLLYNTWKIVATLTPGETGTAKCGLVITLGVK